MNRANFETLEKEKVAGDKIGANRAFIRHNPDVIARQIMKIYFS